MHLSCFCSKGSSVSRHTFFLYVLSHIFTTYQNNVKSTSVPHDFTKTTEVQLEGPALVPSFNSTSSKETLLRRHVKHYNHQVGFLVGFEGIFRKSAHKLEVRCFLEYMSFGCGSVFFFQISKLTSSLLHRKHLEGGYF